MINVLLSAAYMVAAQQKKNGRRGAQTKRLFTAALPAVTEDYTAAAQLLKERLAELRVHDRDVNLILGEEIVFKEFSHQQVGAKALADFAALEAQTVLRENADSYVVQSMHYGPHKNEKGEVTSMLLAVPALTLKKLRAAFAGADFSVESVRSLFGCYTAVLGRALPLVAPGLTGAAIDFGYEYTLINLYDAGKLVSQRRLPGVLAALAPAVMEDTGCTMGEVSEKLAANRFSPAYAAAARGVLTNFTFSILRTLRVLSAPLHIQPEKFFLSGIACRDRTFLTLVQESLALPCILADDEAAKLRAVLAPQGSVTSLMVLSGPAYDTVDLLEPLRAQKTGSIFNATTCVVLTLLVAAGLCVQPLALTVKQRMLAAEQAKFDALAPTQQQITDLAGARGRVSAIQEKSAAVSAYTSNTGTTLPQVLSLFGPDYTLEEVLYSSADGSYQVNFLADTKEHFLALKDAVYANSEYYLNPSLSIVRQQEDGSYLCTMYFVAAGYTPLPEEPAADSTAAADSAVSVTTDQLAEGVSGQ